MHTAGIFTLITFTHKYNVYNTTHTQHNVQQTHPTQHAHPTPNTQHTTQQYIYTTHTHQQPTLRCIYLVTVAMAMHVYIYNSQTISGHE